MCCFRDFSPVSNSWKAHGHHLNLNTIDAFKNCDKMKMLIEFGKKIKDSIESGEAVDCPSLLATFILLTFAVSFYISPKVYVLVVLVSSMYFIGVHL